MFWLLYPRGKSPGTHLLGDWVGPTAGLDDMEKLKLLTLPGLELHPLAVHEVASCYIDSTTAL
jgi:hypothetical protein